MGNDTAAPATDQGEHADTCLLGDWLEFVAKDGWAFLYWPHWSQPNAVAAYREWREFGITDVIALVDETFAFCYRALSPQGADFLQPEYVLYVSEGVKPVHIVRAMLTLPAPHDAAAPDVVEQAPAGIRPYFQQLGQRRTLRPAGMRQPLPRFRMRPSSGPIPHP